MGAGGVIPPQQLLHSVVLSLVRQLNYVALVKVKYDMWYDFFRYQLRGIFFPLADFYVRKFRQILCPCFHFHHTYPQHVRTIHNSIVL